MADEIRDKVLRQLKETLDQRRHLEPENNQPNVVAGNRSASDARQLNTLDPERTKLNNKDFEAEIALKKTYGKWFLIILAAQLLVMNGVFICDGLKWLDFKDLTLQLYMGGTLTEVFGLVFVVTKYLFRHR
jgi:hypothetical protein